MSSPATPGIVVTTTLYQPSDHTFPTGAQFEKESDGALSIKDEDGVLLAMFFTGQWALVKFVGAESA